MGTWRRWRPRPTRALALAVILFGPAAARAQLFPDIYIQRQRPCPATEDPRYGAIRQQYFGYYPTCWRRFPPGWGCPSPEAPNWEAELARMPLQMLHDDAADPERGGDLPPAGDLLRRPDPARDPALDNTPPLPEDRGSLFDPQPDGGVRPFRDDPGAGGVPGPGSRPFRDEAGPGVLPAPAGPGLPAAEPPTRPSSGAPLENNPFRPDAASSSGLPGLGSPTAALPGPVEEAGLAPGVIFPPGLAPVLGPLPPLDPMAGGPGLNLLGETPAAPALMAPSPGGRNPFPPVSIDGPVGGNYGIIDPSRGDTLDGPIPGFDAPRPAAPPRRGPIAGALNRLRGR